MKTLFLKSNLLHIRTNDGEFEVSNPQGALSLLSLGSKKDLYDGKNIEWPYGVELIKQRGAINLTVARLIPEEKKEFKPAQPTPNFPKGGTTFTESAYKEFEASAYKTVSSNTQSCGKFEIKSHYDFEPVESSVTPKAMEKPDFEQIASSRSDIADHSMFLGFKSGCEHVWNTHVVPLQEKWENQKITIREFQEGLHKITGTAISYFSEAERIFNQLESENKALREEIERLKDEVLKEKFPEN